ncbi:MAG: hypothetical protein ACE5H3_10685 [Planctomycetota bacterium]
MSTAEVRHYGQLYPCLPEGCLEDPAAVPPSWKEDWELASAGAWQRP